MNTLTVLVDLSMYDYCELFEPGKELVLPPDTVIGIFSPWQGGGSTFAIHLEKELRIPTEMIWDIQVEDASLLNQHSVDSVYGLPNQAWKQPLALRTTKQHTLHSPKFDTVLQSAATRKQQSDMSDTHAKRDPDR